MVEFAPFRIPLARRLQTFAVSHFVFCFVALALTITIACIYIVLFTSYWVYLIPYFIFYVLDWNTPETGGRRIDWVRKWRLWGYMTDYFPIKLHKTVDLDPNRNYVFGIYPHGVFCVGSFTHFCTNGSGFDTIFPGFKSYLAMLPFWFRVPFYRDYIMSGGLVPATKKGLQAVLDKPGGRYICCITPGGGPEVLLARPGDIKIILKPRFGFLKLALTNGVPLVPVILFGDQNLWQQSSYEPGSWSLAFQNFLLKYSTFCLPSFHARGIFQYNFGLMPYRKSVNTVVGAPIDLEKNPNPTREELGELQTLYIEKLKELFEEHKSKFASKDCKLIIT